MRRATEATGHKTARAYGYATHIKPQGFIIRPPHLTTNTVFGCEFLYAYHSPPFRIRCSAARSISAPFSLSTDTRL